MNNNHNNHNKNNNNLFSIRIKKWILGENILNVMGEQSFFGEIGVLFSVPRLI